MPKSLATFWSEQLPERVHIVQLALCWESMSCTLTIRASLTFFEFVQMTIPSSTVLLQAVKRRS